MNESTQENAITTSVEFSTDDSGKKKVHRGKLKFGAGTFPTLEIEIPFGNHSLDESQTIICTSDSNTYTLFKCKQIRGTIYPDYVAEGKIDTAVDEIIITLSGFSEWMHQYDRFELESDKIIKNKTTRHFSEEFIYKGNHFIIRSSDHTSVRSVSETESTVKELCELRINQIDGSLTIEIIESLAHEIRNLFSLLMWGPINIYQLHLVSNKKRMKLHSWKFARIEETFKSPREYVISPDLMLDDKLWPKVFKNFFAGESRKRFDAFWKRIVGLLNYKGFWEYQILGYVSLFDAYSQSYRTKRNNRINRAVFEEMKDEIKSVIRRYKDLPTNTNSSLPVFESIIAGVDKIRNTVSMDFSERFNNSMMNPNFIDNRINLMIGLTNNEMSILKEIRDLSAHGRPVLRAGVDLTNELTLMNKLAVLLMYLIHKDFGFSDAQFASYACRSLNTYIRDAHLNEFHRDSIIGKVLSFNVSPEFLALAKQLKSNHLVLRRNGDDLKIDNEATKAVHVKWLLGKHSELRLDEFVKHHESLNEFEKVEYVSYLYLINGSVQEKIYSACIIQQQTEHET